MTGCITNTSDFLCYKIYFTRALSFAVSYPNVSTMRKRLVVNLIASQDKLDWYHTISLSIPLSRTWSGANTPTVRREICYRLACLSNERWGDPRNLSSGYVAGHNVSMWDASRPRVLRRRPPRVSLASRSPTQPYAARQRLAELKLANPNSCSEFDNTHRRP